MQGAELPAEAVSGLPGGAGDPAGVGERGASSANHQPGYQLLLRPVSLCVTCSRHSMPTLVIPLSRSCIRARQESLIALLIAIACVIAESSESLPHPSYVSAWCLETVTVWLWWTTSRKLSSSTWAHPSCTARLTPTRGSLAPRANNGSPLEVSRTPLLLFQ